jgi:hypothetical protein
MKKIRLLAKYKPEMRILIWALLVYGVGLLIMFPFIFMNIYGLLIGWSIGMVISIINYLLLIYQSYVLAAAVTEKSSRSGLAVIFHFIRMFLYIGGLVTVGLLYRNNINHFDLFTLFSQFGAYIVIAIIIFITGGPHQATKQLINSDGTQK